MQQSSYKAKKALLQGIWIEKENARLYSEWADRFRPYNLTISSLFEDLCEEEKIHQIQLEELYLSVFDESADMSSHTPNKNHIELFDLPLDHFFVVNQKMANQILDAALITEQNAHQYYQDVLLKTKDPALRAIYTALAEFEEDHVKEIQSWISMRELSEGNVSDIDESLMI